PSAEKMAERLATSVRSLHRALAQQGQTYKAIVDDLRRSLAIELLENTALSVDDISARVGFSEATNFRKAFKKWSGRAPSDFRTAPASMAAAGAPSPLRPARR